VHSCETVVICSHLHKNKFLFDKNFQGRKIPKHSIHDNKEEGPHPVHCDCLSVEVLTIQLQVENAHNQTKNDHGQQLQLKKNHESIKIIITR